MKDIFAVTVAAILALGIAFASHSLVHIEIPRTENDLIILLEIAGVVVMLVLVVKKQVLHAIEYVVKLMRGQRLPAEISWKDNFDIVFTSILFSLVLYFAFVRIVPQLF
jgi:hypothetical protein